MQIRTEKDVEKLKLKIQNELGVNVEQYHNEEVVEKFVELLVFPQYVANWVTRPLSIALILFVVGFFVLDLVHIEYLVYGVAGFFLFLFTGLFAGLLFLTWKMKSDLWGIIDYSIGILKSAVNDLGKVSDKISSENRRNVLGLLFKGIIHIVTIPMMSKVVGEKVPFVSGMVNGFMKKTLTLVSDRVKFDETLVEEEMQRSESEPNPAATYAKSIDSVSTGLESIMGLTFKVAQYPLLIGFCISTLLLVVFVYLVN